jgi:hypothetical protein
MIKSTSLASNRAEAKKKFGCYAQTISTLDGDIWTTELISKDDPIFTRGYVIGFSPIKQPKNTSKKK